MAHKNTKGGNLNKEALMKKRIGVLLGGKSSEREVSLKSGGAVLNALKSAKYNVVAIDAQDDLCFQLSKEKVDVAFIVLHGGHGENGAIQGMLEVMNIPYTGSGVLASAMAMDKEITKKIFANNNIPLPPFRVIDKGQYRLSKGKGTYLLSSGRRSVSVDFGLPWVVKPAAEGSSVGVEIVKEEAKLAGALRQAFSYGNRVIIEKYIKGKEVQIGILNNRILGGVEVRPSLEFYSYEAKYTAGLTQYIFPPEIDGDTYKKVSEAALAAHRCLRCSGATRVDLIVDARKRPYVLEVNTIPGMTETSLLPKIAKNAGFDFISLLEEILGGISFEG